MINRYVPSLGGHASLIERHAIGDVSDALLDELRPLCEVGYDRTRIFADLLADLDAAPSQFALFIARDADSRAVGMRVIRTRQDRRVNRWAHAAMFGHCFAVAASNRGQGVGTTLLAASNAWAFRQDRQTDVLYGASNEAGAINLHASHGAAFSVATILEHFSDNRPVDAVRFFLHIISDPALRGYRFPTGSGIDYAYPSMSRVADSIASHGWVTRGSLNSFSENAEVLARHAASHLNAELLALADDSRKAWETPTGGFPLESAYSASLGWTRDGIYAHDGG